MFILILQVTIVTLTFNRVNPKSMGGLVHGKNIQYVKYESSVINCFKNKDLKPFGLLTDGQTDRRTDRH